MHRYHCVAHGNGEDIRFTVRAEADDQAVELAREEALKQDQPSVFVEDDLGGFVFDGPAAETALKP